MRGGSNNGFTWAVAAAVTLVAGCAPNPASGVAASGDTLRVQYLSGTGSYVSNDVVSTSVLRDKDGNEVASADHYAPVEHSFKWQDWKYFQGREELDEQDFYRIAGDQQAATKVADIRASAALKMKIGAPIMIAGVAAAIVLTMVGRANDNPSLTTTGYLAGGAVGTVGGLVWYWGSTDMKQRHHLPAARADQNADLVEDCDEGRCRREPGGHQRTRASVP